MLRWGSGPTKIYYVLAASTGGASGVRLDVRDYGEIDAAEVVKFRK